MSSALGTLVKSAIQTYAKGIIDQVVAGELTADEATQKLSTVIDMAVRRDPDFAEAINLTPEQIAG